MQKLDSSFCDMRFWLSKVPFIDASPLFIEFDTPIVLRPHGVSLTFYQGEIHTWELLLCLCQAAPGIASRPT